jgi:hypothetical protein
MNGSAIAGACIVAGLVGGLGQRPRHVTGRLIDESGAAEDGPAGAWHARVRRRRQSSRLSGFKNVVDRQVDELGGDHHCQQQEDPFSGLR